MQRDWKHIDSFVDSSAVRLEASSSLSNSTRNNINKRAQLKVASVNVQQEVIANIKYEYNRIPYIVGLKSKYHSRVLEALGQHADFLPPLLLQGQNYIEDQTTRYFNSPLVDPDDKDSKLIKHRKISYKLVYTSDGLTSNLNYWLMHIHDKAMEFVAMFPGNTIQTPVWALKDLSMEEEVKISIQSAELLSKAASVLDTNGYLQWNDNRMIGAAVFFIIMLHLKEIVKKDFDVLIDCVKWLKTWSNDYIRIDDICCNLCIKLHTQISIEPLFWQFISAKLLKANITLERFTKIACSFMDHLIKSMNMLTDNGDHLERVKKSSNCILVILTECVLLRFIQHEEYELAVNTTRAFLSLNLINDSSTSTIGNLRIHEVLYSLSHLTRKSNIEFDLSMKLCNAVESWILSISDGLNLCAIKPISVQKLPIKPILLHIGERQTLATRILAIFGSPCINYESSNTRWYNIIKASVLLRPPERCFAALLTAHLITTMGINSSLLYTLQEMCDDTITRIALEIQMKLPTAWAVYALNFVHPIVAIGILEQALSTTKVPDLHRAISYIGLFVSEHLQSSRFLKEALEHINVKQSYLAIISMLCKSKNDKLSVHVPSNECIMALYYIFHRKGTLENEAVPWGFVSAMSETDVKWFTKAFFNFPNIIPRVIMRFCFNVLRLYENNEEIVSICIIKMLQVNFTKAQVWIKFWLGHRNRITILHVLKMLSISCTNIDFPFTKLIMLNKFGRLNVEMYQSCTIPMNLPHFRFLDYYGKNGKLIEY